MDATPKLSDPGAGSTQVMYRDAHMLVAARGPLLVVSWFQTGGGGAIQPLHQAARALARSHPHGLCLLVLAGEAGGSGGASGNSGAIQEGVRSAALEFLRDPQLPLRLVGVVFGGQGLRAAALRSFLTGLSLLARTTATLRFLSSEADADAWLAGAGLAGLAPGDARQAVREFRALVAAKPA